MNQKELSLFLKNETYLIKQKINEKKLNEKLNSQNQEIRKGSSKIKSLVCDLEDNFYLISVYCNYEKIEERLKTETFENYELVKKKFVQFYYVSKFNSDYDLLIIENKKFNEFLNEQNR